MTLSKAFSTALLVYLCQIEAGKAQSANLPNQGANVFHPTPSTQSGQFAQDSAANMVPGETSSFEEQLRATLSALVASNDFDALEKIADGFRISKAQTTDGTWHLLSFYRVLSKLPDNTTHGQWDERIAFLNKWTSAKPDSITARVALAECYKNCAWSERGYGYADTVSVGGWQLFSRGLEQAKQVLTDAKKLKAKCPMWWDAAFICFAHEHTKDLACSVREQWSSSPQVNPNCPALALQSNFC